MLTEKMRPGAPGERVLRSDRPLAWTRRGGGEAGRMRTSASMRGRHPLLAV